MKRSTWITAVVLAATLVIIVAALVREATRGPTFRAEDHATYEACVGSIPVEWGPGSIQRSGAEESCRYVHLRGRGGTAR